MKGLAMRLFHMGMNAFVVGEMTATALGRGDLLLTSAGPGYFSTVTSLSGEAQRAGEGGAPLEHRHCTSIHGFSHSRLTL
jgi:D-arabinose 5-phosphate isomerase GutQ